MRVSPIRGARRVLAALLIGFGTIFGTKAPNQHWATPPTVLMDRTDVETDAGDLPACA